MASTDTPRLISDVRGVRYGEVICAFLRDGRFEAEVYGTQFLNDCPQDLWEGLDAEAIAEEMEAAAVKLNGPRLWTLDGMGTKVNALEPVLREFNGLLMRRLAVIDLGDNAIPGPYSRSAWTVARCSSSMPASRSMSSSPPTGGRT